MTATLIRPLRPEIHDISDIYDPDFPDRPGRVVPRVTALVRDGSLWKYVSHVGEAPYEKTTLSDMITRVVTEGGGLVSVVSYGNDLFSVYYDTRTSPTTIRPDRRASIFGTDASKYKIVRYPGTTSEQTISRYYDTNGDFVSELVPMVRKGVAINEWFCPSCFTQTIPELTTGEPLRIDFYSETNGLFAQIYTVARFSAFVNVAPNYENMVTSVRIESSQMYAPNDIFMMEKQDIASLNLQVIVSYDDGREIIYPVDNQKTFLYGISDLVASWAGMRQAISAKVFLEFDEQAAPDLGGERFVTCSGNITIIANEKAAPIKISVIPVWNTLQNQYQLRYVYYTTDRDKRIDVTSHVTLTGTQFNGQLYGVSQELLMNLDLSLVDNTIYTEPVTHQQPFVITLQPNVAYVKYVLRSSLTSQHVYGADSSSSRRPILYYDSAVQQYFIPTSVFPTKAAMLRSFYENGEPAYVPQTESGPLDPTHFVLRDATSGAMLVAAQIPIDDYGVAFNILGGGLANRLVGTTVVVEFIRQQGLSTNLILYGVPVDVRDGTYIPG